MTLLNYSVVMQSNMADFIKKNHFCFYKNSVHIWARRPSYGTAVTKKYRGRQK
jgi:hypothetical protein